MQKLTHEKVEKIKAYLGKGKKIDYIKNQFDQAETLQLAIDLLIQDIINPLLDPIEGSQLVREEMKGFRA